MKSLIFLTPILLAITAFAVKDKEDKGITRSDAFTDFVREMSADRKYAYGVFAIQDQQIIVESSGARDASYETFVADLQKSGESRYGLYAYPCEGSTDDTKRVLVFVFYVPDKASIKNHQLYANLKDTFRKGVNGVRAEIQATDKAELRKELVEEKLKKCASGDINRHRQNTEGHKFYDFS